VRIIEGVARVDDVDAFVERVGAAGAEGDCAAQVFDAGLLAGPEHLHAAVAHANRSFARGENVADDRAVEILLYAAGRRQIREALAMGVGEGETPAVAVVDDGTLRPDGRGSRLGPADADEAAAAAELEALLEPAETLGGDAERIAEFFDIGAPERRASDAPLSALVRERVALLDVEK
jgi:KEOPS complex subunit Cgi121